MKASALVVAERDRAGRTVLRQLRPMAPLTLFPRRGRADESTVVHLVNSAAAPLGGDDLTLTVEVGPGAKLRLVGVAAALVLPGHRPDGSRSLIRMTVADGGEVEYVPAPTVVTARARHEAYFAAELTGNARLRCHEVLVLGREGERPGRLASTLRVTRDGVPLLAQRLEVGDPATDRSAAYLAGHRVLASEALVWGADPPAAVGEDWWSLVPLAAGGSLATAIAPDAVTAGRRLDRARAAHPGWVTSVRSNSES